jgi:hypothetical protein
MHNIYVTLSHIRSFNGVVLLQDIIIQDICRANFKKMSLEMTYAVKSKIEQMNIPTWGLGSPPGLPKLQSSIARLKTPRLEAFFI